MQPNVWTGCKVYLYHQLKLRPLRNRIIVYVLSLFFCLFSQYGILH